ncbi:unnamed protein product [Ixodes hexagonus]
MEARVLVLALILLSSALLAGAQFGGRRYPGGVRGERFCGGRFCPRGSRCVQVRCFRAPCPNIRNCEWVLLL